MEKAEARYKAAQVLFDSKLYGDAQQNSTMQFTVHFGQYLPQTILLQKMTGILKSIPH
jgi:hypothetical protein